MTNPEYPDLLKDVSDQLGANNDYFLVTITDLDLATTYPLEFRWKYQDGTYGKSWSSVYNVTTQGSTVPNEPQLLVTDVEGLPEKIKVTWSGNDSSGNPIQNFDRVDVHISGTTFGDGTKPAGNFKKAGTLTFAAEPGIYIVQLKAYRVDGTSSFFSTARTVTVTKIEELIEAPIAPTGFSARAILGGIEVTWNGTYSGGATWSGFGAINIYAGTSSSATGGTYIKVNQMTGNKTSNKVVVPIDGTYVRYGFPAYIHASSINKATPPVESSISANVASATPSQVVNTDLIDAVISEAKLALNAVTETKIANDAITTPKIVAGAITAGKIAALTITADKIAANTIDVGKLAANTISVGNLEAGDIKSTSYIRAGSAGGARVEISSTTVGSVLPGLTVYGSGNGGTDILLRAPLTGGLTVTGSLTATQISTSSGKFSVNTSGILSASDVTLTGTIKATAGFIGGDTSGIYIAAGAIQNDVNGSQFKIDSSGKARFGSSSGNAIVIDPTSGNGGYYMYHTSGGQNGSASGVFSVSTSGNLTSTSGSIGGWTIGSTTITGGSTTLNSNGTISGATITGGTIATATSGNRIELNNGSYLNKLAFYTPSTFPGEIYADGSTYGILTLQAPYSSGSPANIVMYSLGANSYIDISSTLTVSTGSIGANSFYTGTPDSNETAVSAGTYLANAGYIVARRTGAAPIYSHRIDGGVGPLRAMTFYSGGVFAGGINMYTNQIAQFVNPSDYRLKENIQDYLNASEVIKKIRLRKFNFKNDPAKEIVGFIAHEYAEVNPDFVIGEKDAVDENGNPIYQEMMMGGIDPYLIGALKEAILKIESLEARLDALEG